MIAGAAVLIPAILLVVMGLVAAVLLVVLALCGVFDPRCNDRYLQAVHDLPEVIADCFQRK